MTIGTYIICRIMNLNIEFRSAKSWRTLLKRHAAFILQGFVLAGMQFVMPLGIVHTIASAGPIVTMIMQRIIRKDHSSEITGNKLLGCIISVVGIVMTSNGKFIYSCLDPNFEFKSDFSNYIDSSEYVIILATAVLVLSMMFWSYGVLITQEA
jgi:drug/metabolite transporter (DMT)-like permease